MLRLAQVVAVHPARRSVDLVFMDNGQRCAEVPVMAGALSSDGGMWAVPSVERPASEAAAGGIPASGRAVLAACGFVGDRPAVLAFHQPANGQVAPTEQDRAIFRHPSGTYATVAPDGTVEVKHASGAHLRIGTGATAPVPGVPEGSGADPTVTLKTSTYELKINPDGTWAMTASSDGTMTMPNLTINANVAINGNLGVTGAAGGGGGSNITLNGDITHTGNTNQTGNTTQNGSTTVTGEVTAGTIPLTTHHHTGVQPGSGSTGTPTP